MHFLSWPLSFCILTVLCADNSVNQWGVVPKSAVDCQDSKLAFNKAGVVFDPAKEASLAILAIVRAILHFSNDIHEHVEVLAPKKKKHVCYFFKPGGGCYIFSCIIRNRTLLCNIDLTYIRIFM